MLEGKFSLGKGRNISDKSFGLVDFATWANLLNPHELHLCAWTLLPLKALDPYKTPFGKFVSLFSIQIFLVNHVAVHHLIHCGNSNLLFLVRDTIEHR